MSADKRTVATDALETLGMIISENEKRDAIHLAVEPVIASGSFAPNEDVGVEIRRGKLFAVTGPEVELVGKVDPFLERRVRRGEMFWLVIYPRQIKSLRHVWEHPSFPSSQDLEASAIIDVLTGAKDSENWIASFATQVGLDYDELVEAAEDYISSGAYLNKGDLLEGVYVPDEFWDHYSAVTGEVIDDKDRNSFFTCSC